MKSILSVIGWSFWKVSIFLVQNFFFIPNFLEPQICGPQFFLAGGSCQIIPALVGQSHQIISFFAGHVVPNTFLLGEILQFDWNSAQMQFYAGLLLILKAPEAF